MTVAGATFDADRLLDSVEMVVPALSSASAYADNGAHHLYRRTVLVDNGRYRPPGEHLRWVLDRFDEVHTSWLSWIGPGGFVVPHIDQGKPYRRRWQVPVVPGLFDHGDHIEQHQPGTPFEVRHWEPHAVWNPGDKPRISIVVDCEPLPIPHHAFTLLAVPGEFAALVAAA